MERRTYSAELKQKIVDECLKTGNHTMVARKYEISGNTISNWLRKYRRQGSLQIKSAFQANNDAVYTQITSENEQLKKLLGEKDLEIAILKDLIKKANPLLPTR
ncbi:MAG: transposase [Thermodesulfovibrionales bacterium]